jgi:hypothetical protein
MVDNRLTQSQYMAVPLKRNINSTLSPQPNWLVIENIFGKLISNIPSMGETVCAQTIYKIVFREILPAVPEMGKIEEMREIIYEQQNQPIPLTIVPFFSTYETLSQYTTYINTLLGLFQFRGILNGFVLEVDEDMINLILEPPIVEETIIEEPITI